MRPLRQPVMRKPHVFLFEGIYDCGMVGTIRGFGYTPVEAYADWRQINVEKGRIENDTSKWPLPRPHNDRRGGSR